MGTVHRLKSTKLSRKAIMLLAALAVVTGAVILLASSRSKGSIEPVKVEARIKLNELITNDMSQIEELEGTDRKVEAYLRKWWMKGASLAIMRNDSLLYAKGYGWADEEKEQKMEPGNILRMASVSKLITAAGIMVLQDKGMLSIKDTVDRYSLLSLLPKNLLGFRRDLLVHEEPVRERHAGDKRRSLAPLLELTPILALLLVTPSEQALHAHVARLDPDPLGAGPFRHFGNAPETIGRRLDSGKASADTRINLICNSCSDICRSLVDRYVQIPSAQRIVRIVSPALETDFRTRLHDSFVAHDQPSDGQHLQNQRRCHKHKTHRIALP